MLHHVWTFLVLGSIIGDVGGWLSGNFKKIKDLAGAVWKAIKHLWAVISAVFHHVGGAWLSMWKAITALDKALSFLADSTRNTLKWIVNNLNPKSIGHAINGAVSWAAKEIAKVAHSLSARLTGVYQWAKRQVTSLSARLTGIYRYLVKKANQALDWIGHTGKTLWTKLGTAAHAAAYIVAALVKPLFSYIVGHIESISLMVARWALANIGKLAGDLERALARLF